MERIQTLKNGYSRLRVVLTDSAYRGRFVHQVASRTPSMDCGFAACLALGHRTHFYLA
jgi:hypothetical protein